MTNPRLSIVVLAFNEEANVAAFLAETLAWIDKRGGNDEIIVVDDGSSDDTRQRALAVAERDARVRVVSHERNLGMGAGMRSGIEAARGDMFTVLAADGQVAAEQLELLLPELERADIVTSIYRQRADRLYRLALSRGLRTFMRTLLGIDFQLEGIYLFPVEVARRDIGLHAIGSATFFFSFELIARALARGYRVRTVTIEARPRQHGSSKVANLSRIGRVAKEVVRLRLRLAREHKAA